MKFALQMTIALVTTLAIYACGAPMGGGPYGPNPYAPAAGGPTAGGAATTPLCDNRKCHDYCWAVGCMFEEVGAGPKCMAVCENRCGDGFFDDTDAKQIDCAIRAGVSLSCDGAQACCDEHLTNQVCSE